MNDATLLAGELADIAAALGKVAAAVAEVRPQVSVEPPVIPAPVVSVVPAEAPVVNVAAADPPVVNVAAPTVNVEAAEAVGYVVRITERDREGRIVSFRMTPT